MTTPVLPFVFSFQAGEVHSPNVVVGNCYIWQSKPRPQHLSRTMLCQKQAKVYVQLVRFRDGNRSGPDRVRVWAAHSDTRTGYLLSAKYPDLT